MTDLNFWYDDNLKFPARRIAKALSSGKVRMFNDTVFIVCGLKVVALSREQATLQFKNHQSYCKLLQSKHCTKSNVRLGVYKDQAFVISICTRDHSTILLVFYTPRPYKSCNVCGGLSSKKCVCGVKYCSVECQRKDWSDHKGKCQAIQACFCISKELNIPLDQMAASNDCNHEKIVNGARLITL